MENPSEALLSETQLMGFTDLKGRPVSRASTGGWTAALLIIGVEIAERITYYGIGSNLITYLTEVMHVGTASAAIIVNNWSAAASMLPLLGAFLADSYLGRYSTILFSSLLYIFGLVCLTLSASFPVFRPASCDEEADLCSKATSLQLGLFFLSICLLALGQGGHKPCLQAFGADQFDDLDPKEMKQKTSFFNWWYFAMVGGVFLSLNVLVYIQETISWGLGFGIPTIFMVIALGIYLSGTNLYRHMLPKSSPFTKFVRVFVAAFRKRKTFIPPQQGYQACLIQGDNVLGNEAKESSMLYNQFRFLDKATVVVDEDLRSETQWRLCSVEEVHDVKLVLRLFPIWASCFMYGVIFQQSPTFFTKQGKTLDRKIGSLEIPAATLQSFITLTIVLFVPIYDRILVPLTRRITGNERGITLLQRIGIGLFVSILCMTVAALIEMERMKVVKEFDLEDEPNTTVPMSISWLIPQYILIGIADVFTMVGMQEFFYDQMPETMRSMGIGLYLSSIGVGGFLASILITIIDKFSTMSGHYSWLDDNLNRARLDYYYWVIVALSILFFLVFLGCSRHFIYKQAHDERTDRDNGEYI